MMVIHDVFLHPKSMECVFLVTYDVITTYNDFEEPQPQSYIPQDGNIINFPH